MTPLEMIKESDRSVERKIAMIRESEVAIRAEMDRYSHERDMLKAYAAGVEMKLFELTKYFNEVLLYKAELQEMNGQD